MSRRAVADHGRRSIRRAALSAAAILPLMLLPPAAHADPSLAEIAQEIAVLKAANLKMAEENRQIRAANQRLARAVDGLRTPSA